MNMSPLMPLKISRYNDFHGLQAPKSGILSVCRQPPGWTWWLNFSGAWRFIRNLCCRKLVDLARGIAGAKSIVDIHHGHAAAAAIEHS